MVVPPQIRPFPQIPLDKKIFHVNTDSSYGEPGSQAQFQRSQSNGRDAETAGVSIQYDGTRQHCRHQVGMPLQSGAI